MAAAKWLIPKPTYLIMVSQCSAFYCAIAPETRRLSSSHLGPDPSPRFLRTIVSPLPSHLSIASLKSTMDTGTGSFPRRARALALRAWKVLRVNWHLGVTAFGGPPVHFRIVSEMHNDGF